MTSSQPNTFRSIISILVAFVAVVVLSFGTDELLHIFAGFPPIGHVYSQRQFLWATLYRTIYGVVGSYITAALAPWKPMKHSLIGGAIGFVLSGLGVVGAVMEGPNMGPLWYPIALLIGVLPAAWLGAKIRIMQTGSR
jgi:hypothetical protein